MRDADVVLNIASTTSLDAIAADTLVVNIGFNALPTPPDSTHARYYGLPSQGDRGERGLLASRDRQQNCGCS